MSGMKRVAGAFDGIARPPSGVVVLIYHRLGGGSSSEIDLPPDLFDEQMSSLASTGRVVPLATALEVLGEPEPPEGPLPMVVTFDDGTGDFVDVALPVLVRHRIPVTLYVATAFMGASGRVPGGRRPLSWSALAEAVSTGLVDVGSHTHGHFLLDRFPAAQVGDELDRSIELIGEHLGQKPLDFAYPKAVPGSPAAERAVRQRFRSAALAGTRPNLVGATDLHRLARSPVQRSDGMRWFGHKVAGGMGLEDRVRRLANRRRYANDTT